MTGIKTNDDSRHNCMGSLILGSDKPVIRDVNADAVQSISDLMNELADDETTRAVTYESND